MYVIFSVNEQQGLMMGFVENDDDAPAEFESLEKAIEWCKNDAFRAAKSHYVFDIDMREIVYDD